MFLELKLLSQYVPCGINKSDKSSWKGLTLKTQQTKTFSQISGVFVKFEINVVLDRKSGFHVHNTNSHGEAQLRFHLIIFNKLLIFEGYALLPYFFINIMVFEFVTALDCCLTSTWKPDGYISGKGQKFLILFM